MSEPMLKGEPHAFEDSVVIYQGAEALVSRGRYRGKDAVLKRRLVKGYRHPLIDHEVREKRTRMEVQAIRRAKEGGVLCPKVLDVDVENSSIYLEYIEGKAISDCLRREDDTSQLAREVGEAIAKLHGAGVIHNDLTTTNILKTPEGVAFIDFGLATTGRTNYEVRSVDLYVLERALGAVPEASPMFDLIFEAYQDTAWSDPSARDQMEARYNLVRARGRKR
ncbi:TP53 regulating kinase [Giardia muris]|uniref:non-specific serine/threonine protein kinase n=1 Tax=Giardia muris TaxID=5742 RepID=A0A4Z1SLJ2_GIAMU|nr:TP53 regulating kinase [Giardia muris]|eukprot:TNJ26514.1 TP53 regulating kinase [Giardia muris]